MLRWGRTLLGKTLVNVSSFILDLRISVGTNTRPHSIVNTHSYGTERSGATACALAIMLIPRLGFEAW